MSEPVRVRNSEPSTYQWVLDDKPCKVMPISANKGIMVEVRGDMNNGPVTFTGSMVGGEDMPVLDKATKTPWFGILPSVSFVQPVTKAVGLTIYLRAIT